MRFWKTGLAGLAITVLVIKTRLRNRRDDKARTIELPLWEFELETPNRPTERQRVITQYLRDEKFRRIIEDSMAEFELRYGTKPRVLPTLTDMEYDPISGTFYSPSAIWLTMRRLNDKIEDYLHKLVLDLMRSQTNARH